MTKSDAPVLRRCLLALLLVGLPLFVFTSASAVSSTRAAAAAGEGWEELAVVPGGAVNGVAFADGLRGWIVNAAVLATVDGGATWDGQTSEPGWLLQDVAVTAADGRIQGWAVGADVRGQRGIIVASTPGGAWVERASFTTGVLTAVDFSGPLVGYAVGENGTIVVTTDGGAKWAAQTTREAWDLQDVSVVPAAVRGLSAAPAAVFAVGSDPKTQAGVIVTPTAGGGWAERAAFSGAPLTAVTFADRSHGWAVGAGGAIVTTDDGGATWRTQKSGGSWDLRGVTFVDPSRGWAVGAGVILATTNGGQRWSVQSASRQWDLQDVAFIDATHGFAVGQDATSRRGIVLGTSNGGVPAPAAPTITGFTPASGPEGTVVTVSGTRFSADAVVAFGGTRATSVTVAGSSMLTASVPVGAVSGPITVTTPGGTATSAASFLVTPPPAPGWAAQTSGTGASLRAVAGADAARSWAVGDGGTILVTSDGGLTWMPQSSGTGAALHDAVLWTGDRAGATPHGAGISATISGCAVGDGGTILITANGGTTWSPASSGTSADLSAVTFPDALHGWAVGTSGTILVSTNGGTIWSTQSVLGGASLSDIAFPDLTHGWAVGDGGTIVVTANGGTTWSPQDTGSGASLASVDFTDRLHGWVVGDGGTILVTSNGGTTWVAQDSGTTVDLHGVTFVDDARGWVVGDGGTILITANGGTTWSAQYPVGGALLLAVSFPDTLHGWVVGANGTILFTASGGLAPAPRIAKLRPTAARRGAKVTITGAGFGDVRGAGFVKFGGKKSPRYLSWTDTTITCRVPEKVKYGAVKVTVTTALGRSNAKAFRVKR